MKVILLGLPFILLPLTLYIAELAKALRRDLRGLGFVDRAVLLEIVYVASVGIVMTICKTICKFACQSMEARRCYYQLLVSSAGDHLGMRLPLSKDKHVSFLMLPLAPAGNLDGSWWTWFLENGT